MLDYIYFKWANYNIIIIEIYILVYILSGLLSLRSVPAGLISRPYVAGTKEEVVAFYGASCCNQKVVLTATDLAGNQNSYTVDVSGKFKLHFIKTYYRC